MIKLNALSEWNYEYFTMDEVDFYFILFGFYRENNSYQFFKEY